VKTYTTPVLAAILKLGVGVGVIVDVVEGVGDAGRGAEQQLECI